MQALGCKAYPRRSPSCRHYFRKTPAHILREIRMMGVSMRQPPRGLPTVSATSMARNGCYICAALSANTVEGMLAQEVEAKETGADVMEIRLDLIHDFEAKRDLPRLMNARSLPAIITYRPKWEGGEYDGEEGARLDALRQAIELGADFVDVELQVAQEFIAQHRQGSEAGPTPPTSSALHPTQIIVSSHNYLSTPSTEELSDLIARIQATGADIVKFATFATDVCDTARIFQILGRVQTPTIALVMGPRGQISRLLAPKFGAFLTFGSLGSGKESAPGQPTVGELAHVYRLGRVGRFTKVYGLIGNPVGHSKGPVLHNRGLLECQLDGIYVPFLVDDVRGFLRAYDSPDFAGFSVTIPHKQTALECCDEVDPLAKAIGAVNTIVRREDGKLVGYNTDVGAAISAIEEGLRAREGREASGLKSPLEGRLCVVVGAGGAGRALAFGAKQKGAVVIIANRNFDKAQELATAVGAWAIPLAKLGDWDKVAALGKERGADITLRAPVLANTTSVGMQPNVDETPVPASGLRGYSVVFDAVYTPLETRLLKEARGVGSTIVSGLEMFIGQAAEQFELFTGRKAPKEVMRDTVMKSIVSS